MYYSFEFSTIQLICFTHTSTTQHLLLMLKNHSQTNWPIFSHQKITVFLRPLQISLNFVYEDLIKLTF